MMREDWNPTDLTRSLSIAMTEWQSESGTEGEAGFGERLAALIRTLPWFRDHPDAVRLLPSHDGTQNVVALLRGPRAERRTIAFAGHYDTVPVANYRDLAALACQPEPLMAALLDDLSARPLSPQEEKALADFESGDFLPGRGLLDMKSGLAAGLAVIDRMSREPDFSGNLLFIATPDEERNSRGMRAMRDALPALAAEWDIEIVGGINLDATSDQGDGAEGRAIYAGTIGKLLPFAYVIGQPSHASYPFDGASAHMIAAEILRRVEANPALCDTGDGELSPPPICLEGKDFRAGYDVTTPDKVWLAFNWLFHSWQPDHLFARFNGVVREALDWATSTLTAHAEAYAALGGARPAVIDDGLLMTFEDLKRRAFEAGGAAAEARFADRAEAVARQGNPLAASQALTELLVEEARLAGPAVVTGFAGLHYAPTHVDRSAGPGRQLFEAIEAARAETEAEDGVSIRHRAIFTGISDMSYFGHRPEAEAARAIAANTVHPAYVDHPPGDALSFPAVNIGPWGREYHQRLERVHAPYAFGQLPRFLARIIHSYFANVR
jgi:arginine utilization protein RocB